MLTKSSFFKAVAAIQYMTGIIAMEVLFFAILLFNKPYFLWFSGAIIIIWFLLFIISKFDKNPAPIVTVDPIKKILVPMIIGAVVAFAALLFAYFHWVN